jgi:tRNA(Arg) A34 adenosine deaminase TadA
MTTEHAPVERLLDIIEHDILPKTRAGVASGNKVFGAAIIDKSDGSVVMAETNNETENPLWHGEMHALKRFYEMPEADRPDTRDCYFLSTHEPCSLCMSAITWAGFDNFHYLFSHADSRDTFAIPHDLKILKEVFRLEPGGYNQKNAYWTAFSIPDLVNSLPEGRKIAALEQIRRIETAYQELSTEYQKEKDSNAIPLR